MLEISSSLNIDITDGVSISDFINHPEKHFWQIDFEFPQDEYRDAKDTPNGKKYGSSSSFAAIYEMLNMPFIDMYFSNDYYHSSVKQYGDNLLLALNSSIGLQIEQLKTTEGEVYEITKNSKTNRTRLENAEAKYENYQRQYYNFQDYLEDLESDIRLTKKGNFDRRTTNYHIYMSRLQESYEMRKQLDTLYERLQTEQKRFDNSYNRATDATKMLRKIKSGTWHDIKAEYRDMADRYTEAVKDDIIGKANSGVLPMQNLPLMESTIKKRHYAGITSVTRFWATGQLVRSIKITCTLV